MIRQLPRIVTSEALKYTRTILPTYVHINVLIYIFLVLAHNPFISKMAYIKFERGDGSVSSKILKNKSNVTVSRIKCIHKVMELNFGYDFIYLQYRPYVISFHSLFWYIRTSSFSAIKLFDLCHPFLETDDLYSKRKGKKNQNVAMIYHAGVSRFDKHSHVYIPALLNPSDRLSLHHRMTFSSVTAISHSPAFSSSYA